MYILRLVHISSSPSHHPFRSHVLWQMAEVSLVVPPVPASWVTPMALPVLGSGSEVVPCAQASPASWDSDGFVSDETLLPESRATAASTWGCPFPELVAQEFSDVLTEAAKKAVEEVAAAESGARAPKTGQEKKASLLGDAIAAGDVDVRGPLGQQFTAFLKANPEAANNYKQAGVGDAGSRNAAKKAFRLNWAQARYEEVTEVKTKLEAFQEIDEEDGVYEPLEMIAVHEGGKDSKAAWTAAINYAKRAMMLGGKWLAYNSFTQRVDILYVKKRSAPPSTVAGPSSRR